MACLFVVFQYILLVQLLQTSHVEGMVLKDFWILLAIKNLDFLYFLALASDQLHLTLVTLVRHVFIQVDKREP